MNKEEFLNRFFKMYQNTFTNDNMKIWAEAYNLVFGNRKINYDKLFEIMVMRYQNTLTAPPPAWFKECMGECLIKMEKCSALIYIEKIKKEPSSPPPEDFKQKLQALIAKTAM